MATPGYELPEQAGNRTVFAIHYANPELKALQVKLAVSGSMGLLLCNRKRVDPLLRTYSVKHPLFPLLHRGGPV